MRAATIRSRLTRRLAAIALVLLLLAGCTSSPSPPPSPSPQPPSPLQVLSIDGRWPFDATEARGIVARAWGISNASVGALLRGEARVRAGAAPVAIEIAGLDASAAALLGEPASRLPRAGEIVLSTDAQRALGPAAGRVHLAADAWPESRVTRYHEMELVRSCAANATDPCALEPAANGDPRLRFHVAPRTVELAFRPDPSELGEHDYPAYWNGTFTSPSGDITPFATRADSPSELGEPGRLAPGRELEAGAWTIAFSLEANGTRHSATGPTPPGGILTTRAPGFDDFAYDLYDITDLAAQTRALLANATPRGLDADVAGARAREGTMERLDVDALLAPADAAALLGARAGEATALLLPAGGDADALARALANATDPRVAALHLRPLAMRPAPASTGSAIVLAAPADLDPAALPPVDGADRPILSVELARAWGANDSALGAPDAPFRVLALPFAGALSNGSAWPDAAAALDGIARSPNLVLVSSDLAARAHGNLTYAPLVLDASAGPQRYNIMGAIEGGPNGTAWIAPSLLAAAGAPAGARLVVPIHAGVDLPAEFGKLTAAWSDAGAAIILRP